MSAKWKMCKKIYIGCGIIIVCLSIFFVYMVFQLYMKNTELSLSNQKIQFDLFVSCDKVVIDIDEKINILQKQHDDLEGKFFRYGLDFNNESTKVVVDYNLKLNEVKELLKKACEYRNKKAKNYNDAVKDVDWGVHTNKPSKPREKIEIYLLPNKYK